MKNPENETRKGRPRRGDAPKSLFGKKLKAVQGDEKNSWMQDLMGCSKSSYAAYLSGERVPDAAALARLAAETSVDLNWLLDDTRGIGLDGNPVLYQPRAPTADSTGSVSGAIEMDRAGQLIEENQRLRENLDCMQELVKEMKAERDAARDEARTATHLRNGNGMNGASGA